MATAARLEARKILIVLHGAIGIDVILAKVERALARGAVTRSLRGEAHVPIY